MYAVVQCRQVEVIAEAGIGAVEMHSRVYLPRHNCGPQLTSQDAAGFKRFNERNESQTRLTVAIQ